MATRRSSGAQPPRAPEIPETETPVIPAESQTDEGAEESIEDDGDITDENFSDEDDEFDPTNEPISDDLGENLDAAVSHIKTAVGTLGRVYSSSVVLHLALDGNHCGQDYEIAACLSHQVIKELDRVVHGLLRAGRRLGSDLPNPLQSADEEQ